ASTAARTASRVSRAGGTSLKAALLSFGGLVGGRSASGSVATAVVTGWSLGESVSGACERAAGARSGEGYGFGGRPGRGESVSVCQNAPRIQIKSGLASAPPP